MSVALSNYCMITKKEKDRDIEHGTMLTNCSLVGLLGQCRSPTVSFDLPMDMDAVRRRVGKLVKLITTNCACDKDKHVDQENSSSLSISTLSLPLGVGRAKLS